MNSEAYKRSLIKIYFELLKKHYDNNTYTSLESVKHELEEEFNNYKKQLDATRKTLSEIENFLLHPIPIPPFLKKEIVKILLNEINKDCKSIALKIVSAVDSIDTILMHRNVATKKIWFFLLLFFLLCIGLSYVISTYIKDKFYIFIVIFLFFCFIYIYRKLKHLKYSYEKRVFDWETLCQQKIDEIELLEKQIQASQLYNLEDLEAQIKNWIEEDKQQLIDLGKRHLRIVDLDREPILSLVGISYREKINSHILITDRGIDTIENKSETLLIHENDFYEEKGLDGEYKYGVYEGFVIFLGESFLSYYRCYWNFIKGASVDEETCEYPYYSIVSVKTQERSSLRLQNPEEKRKYRDLLSLTTMDGKIVYFKMPDDKKQKINSSNQKEFNYVSELNEAAARIRYWLRQKRVDYQHVRDIDK